MYDYILFVVGDHLHIVNIAKGNSSFAIQLWEGFQGKDPK